MPGTCALAPNIVAVWGGIDLELVNLARGEHREAPYLAINPKGQVPALVLDDGTVVTEAAAILRYLASQASRGELDPNGSLKWARIDEALSYFTSEIHADFGGHFAPQRYANSEAGQAEVRKLTYEKLREHFERLESALKAAGGSWYLGERSIADAYLFVILRWIDGTPVPIGDFPHLLAYRNRLSSDGDVVVAMRRQQMT